MSFWWILLVVISANADIDSEKVDCKPEQVHISYGDTLSQMVVMWSTLKQCSTQLQYGLQAFGNTNVVNGTSELMPGNTSRVPYLHRALLSGLKPNATYFYIPISNSISSNVFYFHTPPAGQDWQPELLMYGDLGYHSESLPKLNLEAMKGSYAAVIHVGDIAYDLFDTIDSGPDKGENVGDVFMRRIQEMASHVPYMVAPGNHEIESETFYQYRYRFSTPNTVWPIPLDHMFYSMDIGPVHFLSYSSEVFFVADGTYIEAQRVWIQQDLQKANKNRNSVPWVIAFGHRPMYCSNGDGEDCTKADSYVRAGLEDLFYEHGVDVVIQAHEHSYERLWPVYNGTVLAKNYTDPRAPVQLVTGAAGTIYGPGLMNMSIDEPWSAFKLLNKSFNSAGRLKIYNSTHLFWDQFSVLDGTVLDSIWITQHWHGPFNQPRSDNNHDQNKTDGENTTPSSGDSLTERVTKAIKGMDVKVIVAAISGVVVLIVFIIGLMILKRRKSRGSYRRWEAVDEQKSYKELQLDDEVDEFEIDGAEGHASLIGS